MLKGKKIAKQNFGEKEKEKINGKEFSQEKSDFFFHRKMHFS